MEEAPQRAGRHTLCRPNQCPMCRIIISSLHVTILRRMEASWFETQDTNLCGSALAILHCPCPLYSNARCIGFEPCARNRGVSSLPRKSLKAKTSWFGTWVIRPAFMACGRLLAITLYPCLIHPKRCCILDSSPVCHGIIIPPKQGVPLDTYASWVVTRGNRLAFIARAAACSLQCLASAPFFPSAVVYNFLRLEHNTQHRLKKWDMDKVL